MNVCLNPIYYHGRIIYFRQTLEKELPIPEVRGKFEWRLAEKGDFKKLEEFYRPASLKETPAKRFERGDFCLMALDGERIVGMSWCAVKKNYIQVIEKTISIQDGVGCCYNCVTDPHYRGRGLFGAGICRLANILRERGFRELFLYISSNNRSSLKGARKTKFEPYLAEELRRILWMRFYKQEIWKTVIKV